MGCIAIGINVYLGVFKKKPKLVGAIDLSTGEMKELTVEDAAKIKKEILGE